MQSHRPTTPLIGMKYIYVSCKTKDEQIGDNTLNVDRSFDQCERCYATRAIASYSIFYALVLIITSSASHFSISGSVTCRNVHLLVLICAQFTTVLLVTIAHFEQYFEHHFSAV